MNKVPGEFSGDTFCEKQVDLDGVIHGYRILIRAPETPQKSRGGVWRTDQSVDAARYRENIGLVLAVGPKAFQGKGFEEEVEPRCKPGDWVYYSSYEKEQYTINGFLCFFINDDRVHYTLKPEKAAEILGDRY